MILHRLIRKKKCVVDDLQLFFFKLSLKTSRVESDGPDGDRVQLLSEPESCTIVWHAQKNSRSDHRPCVQERMGCDGARLRICSLDGNTEYVFCTFLLMSVKRGSNQAPGIGFDLFFSSTTNFESPRTCFGDKILWRIRRIYFE